MSVAPAERKVCPRCGLDQQWEMWRRCPCGYDFGPPAISPAIPTTKPAEASRAWKWLTLVRQLQQRNPRFWLIGFWIAVLLALALIHVGYRPASFLAPLLILLRPETQEEQRRKSRGNLVIFVVIVGLLVAMAITAAFFPDDFNRVAGFVLPIFLIFPFLLLIADVRYYRRLPPIRRRFLDTAQDGH